MLLIVPLTTPVPVARVLMSALRKRPDVEVAIGGGKGDAARFDKAAAAQEELEKLLNVAVREYEEDFALKQQKEEAAKAGEDFKKFRSKKRAANIVHQMKEEREGKAAEMMRKIAKDLNHPEYGNSIQNTLKILSGNNEGVRTVEDVRRLMEDQLPKDQERASEGTDMDYTIASLLRQMSEIPANMSGLEPGAVEQTGEDIMTTMIAEFERLGEKEDYETFIEGNLKQLLSKEIMYIPVKKICQKFPEWLAMQEDHLPRVEYMRFGRQYQHFQKMVACYETEPDNFPRLAEIMYDIQEYGTPPADIIKELAPGLQFNDEGLPIMPGLGGNLMNPEMPNVPFPDSQVCSIS